MNKVLHGCYKSLSQYLFLIVSFTLFFTNIYSQTKFSAKCSNRTIGKNDFLQIDFAVENAGTVESITPPSFKNFSVVSGPNQQSGITIINGNRNQSVSIGFVLKPLITGQFTIGPAIAKISGKEYRTDPVTIKVTNSSTTRNSTPASPFNNLLEEFQEPATKAFDDYILRKGENVEEKIKKNLFVKIDVNKNTCFVGQPIIATYKLYTRLKSQSNVLKTPSFNGFSVSELEMPDNYSLAAEKYNGRDYNVYTLRKVQLYPLQSGILNLEPVDVENRITFLKDEYADRRRGDVLYELLRDFANETAPTNATEERTVTLASKPVTINVKPLPEAGKPANFKGSVGNFTISADLQKNNISTDDVGNLKIIISGAGNIQLLNAPEVNWPQNVEGFEAKASENVDKFSVPMKGEKIFVYPFSVTKEGDYTVPPVEFSYFDPLSQTYKIVKTDSLSLHATKGIGNVNVFNKNENQSISSEKNIFKNYKYYLAAAALSFLILVIVFINKKQREQKLRNIVTQKKGEHEIKETEAFTIPCNPLEGSEKLLLENKPELFYKELDASFKKYLSEKLKVPVEELSKKKINERLDKCNVGITTVLLVSSVLEDIELNVYAMASSQTAMEEVYNKASEAVSLLDKQIC